MAPKKIRQNNRGVLCRVHKGRPTKCTKYGRPIDAKNINEERPYLIDDLKMAIEMDIHMRKHPNEVHPYPIKKKNV